MKQKKRSRRPGRTGHFALLLLLVLLAGEASGRAAEGLVSCRSLQAVGSAIHMELAIGSPAPANVILNLTLPPGTSVQQATPPLSRFDARSGEAKWLLKELKSGTLAVTLQLSQPVDPRALRGEIRYKHPATGAMLAAPLAPGA